MSIIAILLLVIFVITSLLLVTVVLIQDDQGEGFGGLFGGGSTTPFGSRSGNVLTRFTSILATIFIVSSLALAWINRSKEVGDVEGAARRANQTESVEWWNQSSETDQNEDSQ
ncbi:MAG: preprotein translocase subunit SecG [Spirochaetales bacterium]|nr:preprotein translocase subunit SecG [Spirochaetales bacterium]